MTRLSQGARNVFNVGGRAASWTIQNGVRTLVVGGVGYGVYQGGQFVLSDEGQEFLNEHENPAEMLSAIVTSLGDAGQTVAEEVSQLGAATQVEQWNSFLYNTGGFLARVFDAIGLTSWADSLLSMSSFGADGMRGIQNLFGRNNNGNIVATEATDLQGQEQAVDLDGVRADPDLSAVANSEIIEADIGDILLTNDFSTALRTVMIERSGANFNDESVFEATVVTALARINASDTAIDAAHDLFEQGDLSGQFNFSRTPIGPGPTIANAAAMQADALLDRIGETLQSNGGDVGMALTTLDR